MHAFLQAMADAGTARMGGKGQKRQAPSDGQDGREGGKGGKVKGGKGGKAKTAKTTFTTCANCSQDFAAGQDFGDNTCSQECLDEIHVAREKETVRKVVRLATAKALQGKDFEQLTDEDVNKLDLTTLKSDITKNVAFWTESNAAIGVLDADDHHTIQDEAGQHTQELIRNLEGKKRTLTEARDVVEQRTQQSVWQPMPQRSSEQSRDSILERLKQQVVQKERDITTEAIKTFDDLCQRSVQAYAEQQPAWASKVQSLWEENARRWARMQVEGDWHGNLEKINVEQDEAARRLAQLMDEQSSNKHAPTLGQTGGTPRATRAHSGMFALGDLTKQLQGQNDEGTHRPGANEAAKAPSYTLMVAALDKQAERYVAAVGAFPSTQQVMLFFLEADRLAGTLAKVGRSLDACIAFTSTLRTQAVTPCTCAWEQATTSTKCFEAFGMKREHVIAAERSKTTRQICGRRSLSIQTTQQSGWKRTLTVD